MTRSRNDADRRHAFDQRTAGTGVVERAVWGLAMYGHWDGPDATDDGDEFRSPRRSMWERLGIGQLLGEEPAWRKEQR